MYSIYYTLCVIIYYVCCGDLCVSLLDLLKVLVIMAIRRLSNKMACSTTYITAKKPSSHWRSCQQKTMLARMQVSCTETKMCRGIA